MRFLPLLLLLTVPATAAPSATPVDTFLTGVRRTVLPNGLTVLTAPQPGSGVVAINTWVKAGYFNEPDEVAGMAHLFEHMFFKGSKAFPGAEAIGQEVAGAGGVSNAGTIYDSTNYYFVLPKEGFRRGIEIQADAIANPLFDAAELKKEAEVVIEESNRKLDNPPAVSQERMFATAFDVHRMKRWRIGSNEVLRGIQRDNLLAFFQTLYRPGNIIVTVAGDVTHDEALSAIRDTFGKLPVGTLQKERGPKEPPQSAFKFGASTADLAQAYTVFGWHTVPENHPDELTLDVLGSILGGGRSSRLYRGVIGPDAASNVDAGHMTFDDVGIFTVQASFDESRRATVDERIVREVVRIRDHGPTDYELALARNVMESDLLGELEDALGQAQALSQAESRGSYKDIGERLRRLRGLTKEQVRAAARRYLTVEGMTLYHYQPKDTAPLTREAALARVQAAWSAPATAPQANPVPRLTNHLRGAGASTATREFTLPNGARLVVRERSAAPLVASGVFFRGGRTAETAASAGITRLMVAAMRRGTTTRSGPEIDNAIEFLGTQIGTTVADDYFGFTLGATTSFYEPAAAILADVILNPTFPADGVTQEKSLQLATLKRSLDSGLDRPLQLYRAGMYGDHPYGLDSRGDAQTIEAVDGAALRAWWTANVVGEGATIVVVGDVNADDVHQMLAKQLASLPHRAAPSAVAAEPRLPKAPVQKTEDRDRKQTAMVIGFPTVPPSHPDWAPLRLLQSMTSGLSGTFFAELRGKRSLAYTVFAQAEPLAKTGGFYSYLATEATKQDEARVALLHEMRLLASDGTRAADVDRARSYFAGSTRIQRQANATLVAELARNTYLGLGLDFTDRLLERVKTLTPEDLRAAAGRYLMGDNFVFAAVRGAAPAR